MARPKAEKSIIYNTEVVEELERDVAHWKNENNSNKKIIETLTEQKNDLTAKVIQLEKSNAASYEKIKFLEQTKPPVEGESTKEGFVEIAILPFNGMHHAPIKMDGIQIPSRRDEDNITWISVPVKRALTILNVDNAFKKFFTGPGEKIEGICHVIKHGQIYQEHKVFVRHKKTKDIHGKVEFIQVIVEESKPKA